MTDPKMSRDEVQALLDVQADLECLTMQTLPTPSGAWRVTISSFDVGREITKTDTRELVELLITTARHLEGLT